MTSTASSRLPTPSNAGRLASVITLAYPLSHKPVSDVCDWASASWGFAIYDRIALVGIPLVSVIVVSSVFLARQRLADLSVGARLSLLALAVLTLATQRWLLVANIELIHFPQFALLAALWLVAGLDRPSAYLASTAGGIVDETYQHLVVYRGRSDTYFDINDIVLDAIGAAWAVVLLGDVLQRSHAGEAFAATSGRVRRWLAGPWFMAGAVLSLAIALRLDPPDVDPLLRPTAGGRSVYHVLSTAEGLVVCALLLGIAGWLARDDGRRQRAGGGRIGASALLTIGLIAALYSSACARAFAGTEPVGSIPQTPGVSSPLVTTFWCGPPLAEFSDARAAEIVAAGFTIVGPPCEGGSDPAGNLRALDVAARHGLKLWIADPRFSERARTMPNWEQAVGDAATTYKDHQGFGGYFVTDEPSAAQFEDLGVIVSRLRDVDPRGQVYLNLLADYFPDSIGTGTYREYVERFVTTVRPSILSYDYYPFLVTGDRPSFFDNLALVREVAQKHDLPFMLILLAMPHGNYRDPTEAELRWQALHALAFGARGISYFVYWTPVNVEFADVWKFRHGLIEQGRPTEHYLEAMRLNRMAQAIARQLASFHSVSVADSEGQIATPPPIGPIASVVGGPVTVGLFEDAARRRAVLLVNRDYRQAASITFRLAPGERPPQRFDASADAWSDGGTTVQLTSGGAQLLRWPPPTR